MFECHYLIGKGHMRQVLRNSNVHSVLKDLDRKGSDQSYRAM